MTRVRIGLLTAAFALAATLGQPGAASGKIVGIVYPEISVVYDTAVDAFKKYLAANGFGPGQVEIHVQKPGPDPMSWANALRKFDAVDADLIVVFGDSLLQVACKEKIKNTLGYGFVREPLLCSCARTPTNPAGAAVGVSAKIPLVTLLAKARLMIAYKIIGLLDIAGDPVSDSLIAEVRSRSKDLGYTVTVVPVAKREEAAAALRGAADLEIFLMPWCPLQPGQVEELLTIAAARGLATISLHPPQGTIVPLLALYPNPEEQGHLLGELAVQILSKGLVAVPANPVTPKRIEFEVNLPLAKQLGVMVPMALLESATRVIK